MVGVIRVLPVRYNPPENVLLTLVRTVVLFALVTTTATCSVAPSVIKVPFPAPTLPVIVRVSIPFPAPLSVMVPVAVAKLPMVRLLPFKSRMPAAAMLTAPEPSDVRLPAFSVPTPIVVAPL